MQITRKRFDRRSILKGSGLVAGALLTTRWQPAMAQTPVAETLTIDLITEPGKIDPATTYDADGWSIVHSIYDSLIQYGPTGDIEMLLAESFELVDPLTYRIVLRSGIEFHNGEPLDSRAIVFSVAHILDKDTASQVAANFAVINEVVEIDDLTVDFKLATPAPWLPAQIAAWLALIPPVHGASGAFLDEPIGTGPYRFERWDRGDRIVLAANETYFADSVKGQPIASEVTYRFVADASTRVADLLAGDSDLVRAVPIDQMSAVETDETGVRVIPVSGTAFIRVPTDVEPFADVRVRQALNYAVDVEAIIDALLNSNGLRLPNLFVPNGLGYDPALPPYAYDPEKAKALLADAGYPDGFSTTLDYAANERGDLLEAIAGQLGEVGIDVTVRPQELAVFNAPDWWTGRDTDAAPLRFLTWRPMFDPNTLLSLVFSNTGFLSRHDNPTIQPLIDAFSTTTDSDERAAVAIELGVAMTEEPAAIYLWNLTSVLGESKSMPLWSPRSDDYLLATIRD